jgi:hypothetical protein
MKKKATSFVPVVMAGFKPSAADAELLREVLALDKKWALGLLDRPQYENLFSSGKLAIGRPVPTPEVLKHKPLKPPGRR